MQWTWSNLSIALVADYCIIKLGDCAKLTYKIKSLDCLLTVLTLNLVQYQRLFVYVVYLFLISLNCEFSSFPSERKKLQNKKRKHKYANISKYCCGFTFWLLLSTFPYENLVLDWWEASSLCNMWCALARMLARNARLPPMPWILVLACRLYLP